ncbi:ABC transporter ATP-binding protein [Arcanobacterium haemolyticum]|nr:ABC transporter ATP-binding protein [Arcanobacterium haemolyticum]
MSLVVNNLSVTTSSGRPILTNCSWEVETGGRIGIIGESGSGKSMTALAILGLLPEGMTATGSVKLDGEEILGLPDKQMRDIRGGRIAMVFQEPLTALDPLMKIGRQIAGPLRLHTTLNKHEIAERVDELLRMVALDDTDRIATSYPWQLSGGQRQRVALAMALACEPDIIIADEPTTALDATVQAEILDLLSDLVEKTGTTLIFVTHDLPVIAKVAHDLVVMRHGEVIEHTTVEAGLTAPREAYTKQLVEAALKVNYIPGRSIRGGSSNRAGSEPAVSPSNDAKGGNHE